MDFFIDCVFELVVSMEWKAVLEKLFLPWWVFVEDGVHLEMVCEWRRDGSCCGSRVDAGGQDRIDERFGVEDWVHPREGSDCCIEAVLDKEGVEVVHWS